MNKLISKVISVNFILIYSLVGLNAQNSTHSFSVGVNYSFHKLSNYDNLEFDNINSRTTLSVDNNFSFQSKPLTDGSHRVFDLLTKLDLGYNKYWHLNHALLLGTGIMGSGRNFVLSEYPISRSTGKPTDMPANMMSRRYYNVSIPLQLKLKYSPQFNFQIGVNTNFPLMRSVDNVFYQTKPKNLMYITAFANIETQIYKNWYGYLTFNKGFMKSFNDNISLYSVSTFGFETFNARCYSKGDVLQFGITKYLDSKATRDRLKSVKTFEFKEITTVKSSVIQLSLMNENSDTSFIDLYINNQIVSFNIPIDSSTYVIDLKLEKDKKYIIKLVSRNEENVNTNISIIEKDKIINKYIWKPEQQGVFITRLRAKY